MIVSRQQLYEQVWSVPGSKLALAYGISDVGLAKICKRHRIPRPPRGYWAKLSVGHKVRRIPLPAVKSPEIDSIHIGGSLPTLVVQGNLEGMVRDSFPEMSEDQEISPAPHPLAVATRKEICGVTADRDGLLVTNPEAAAELRVSRNAVERSLKLLELIMQKWEAKGGNICAGKRRNGRPATCLALKEDHVFLTICEQLDENRPLSDPQRLSGRLTIGIESDFGRQISRHWSDTKSRKLEKILSTIVETAVHELESIRTERLDRECVARQEQKAVDMRRSVATRKDADFVRHQELTAQVHAWDEAQRIRQYLAAVKQSIADGKLRIRDEEAFNRWLDWSVKYAESVDPLSGITIVAEEQHGPLVTAAGDLDLTQHTRLIVEKLGIRDSDDLFAKPKEAVRDACQGRFGAVWNEITRVLEGLGYDTSKRETLYEWM